MTRSVLDLAFEICAGPGPEQLQRDCAGAADQGLTPPSVHRVRAGHPRQSEQLLVGARSEAWSEHHDSYERRRRRVPLIAMPALSASPPWCG